MKKFLKFIGSLLLIPYILVVIFVTVCLLNYNDYSITVFKDTSLIPITEDAGLASYKKGDLLVVKKPNNDDIAVNDMIFFYEEDSNKNTVVIDVGKVIDKRKVNDTETTFTMEGNIDYSSEYVIGKVNGCKVYHYLGTILSVLESRWVFLLFIILPILFIFLYEIYAIVLEVKKSLKK